MNPSHSDRIRYLYERYTSAEASRKELAEFFKYAADPANELIFTNLMSGSWDELYEKANELQHLNEAPVYEMAVPRRRKPYRWIAAASVIAVLSISAYFLASNPEKKEIAVSTANRQPPTISPGSNKAVLTLNNGSKIILDSAHTGTVAEQGNTKITESEKGKLAYNTSTEKPTELSYNTLSTPRGGQHQLVLADGTKVWLNAASSITYPTEFSGHERKVMITGEVYFEVVHNEAKPFRVEVNGTEIEDVGTHFNINAYSDEPSMKTTLIEGAVKINKILLKPGQQAVLNNKNQLRVLDNINTENIIAWKDGKFHYESEDIQTIMRQVARWYDVDVVYKGTISETFSGGISRQANVSELLKILEYSDKVKFEIQGKSIIVEPK